MVERSATTRRRLRREIRGRLDPCHICGGEIDYSAPHLDPGEFVIDHVVPLSKGGSDTIENVLPAHRSCNRYKSDKVNYRSALSIEIKRVRDY